MTHPVPIESGFDYRSLKPAEAEKLQKTAKGIKEKLTKSLQDLIGMGQGLLAAKTIVPHGQFCIWLKAEFGWAERTARNLMEVAGVFGSKSAIIADLNILPTALYLLAAPSTPFEARQNAMDRAQGGEKITPAIAAEIIRIAKKMQARKAEPLPQHRLSRSLNSLLLRFRDRCNPENLLDLARQLHRFANEIEKGSRTPMTSAARMTPLGNTVNGVRTTKPPPERTIALLPQCGT
jgi:hypothetical protein